MTVPVEKNTDTLLRYFRENKEELKKMIVYLDQNSPGWRKENVKYFQDLLKIERENR